MFRINAATLLVLFCWIDSSLAAEGVNGNFTRDFIVGLAAAAGATIAFTIIVCFLALCGPDLIGRCCMGRKRHHQEHWFDARDAEKGHPFVQSSHSLMPAYAGRTLRHLEHFKYQWLALFPSDRMVEQVGPAVLDVDTSLEQRLYIISTRVGRPKEGIVAMAEVEEQGQRPTDFTALVLPTNPLELEDGQGGRGTPD
ncbi:hypothetical protein TruAng_001304 [Truncatella angustata]|nr:hypothetical protein TruAng_001304 [Truncatella angustata]